MVHMCVKPYARSDAPWNVRVMLAGPSQWTMSQVPFGFNTQGLENLTEDEFEGSTLWVRGSVVVMEEGRRDAASSFWTARRKGVKG